MEMIIEYFSGTWGMVELAGTIASLICVYLATIHNQWTWFFGAIGVILFGALFYEFKLYSDAGLQILFFLPMQVWGFFKWQEMRNESMCYEITRSFNDIKLYSKSVYSAGIQKWMLLICALAILTGINGDLMASYTDASYPYADALTTWMSVFAQILMIKKFWESWVLWVTMDVIAIGIYFLKGLFVVSGLYFVFLILASIGLYKWYNNWKEQTQ